MRGWLPLYAASVQLGVRSLVRRGYTREALIRTMIPLDPSRYLELPWALRELSRRPGERILDLASPKLLAVALARRGFDVVSVDELASEVATWRELAGRQRRLTFQVADGRALPFADGEFDHAVSISVLEHIPDGGGAQALRELARAVRPGGRILVTLPYASVASEDWRDHPVYADHGAVDGRHFFQRWYDDERIAQLAASAPALRLAQRSVVRLQPNWNTAYNRFFPWLVPLGPLYGLLARERVGPGGDVVRLVFEKA